MNSDTLLWRRKLSREISRCLAASPAEMLAIPVPPPGREVHRICFTGSPGAGKSTLIARWSGLGQGRRTGVVAVDPTSPISGGSLLGDRIRMERGQQPESFFFRSVPSGGVADGLCRNISGVLDTLEQNGFQDIVLETVGIGQGEYRAREIVDTLVVVLMPESGDTIQAMKAGLLEVADIYVINKADLHGADRLRRELAATLALRRRDDDDWLPPIVEVSDVVADGGHAGLEEKIREHGRFVARRDTDMEKHLRRARFRVAEVLADQLKTVLMNDSVEPDPDNLRCDYLRILRAMQGLDSPTHYGDDVHKTETSS